MVQRAAPGRAAARRFGGSDVGMARAGHTEPGAVAAHAANLGVHVRRLGVNGDVIALLAMLALARTPEAAEWRLEFTLLSRRPS